MHGSINGADFEYTVFKAESDTVVLFLHGWGGGLESFAGAYRAVCGMGVTCINYAFPKTVPESWGVYDYAAQVAEFLKSIGAEKPIVIGHSFGGRVALILAAQGLCKKIMLVDGAGLKPRPSLRKALRIAAYHRRVRSHKPLDGFGSKDYNSLEPQMRRVFVRIVNTHLDKLLPYIKCPALLFWGKRDRDTPLYMAKRLRRGIKNSALIVTDGGHYSYLDAPAKFALTLKSFVSEE